MVRLILIRATYHLRLYELPQNVEHQLARVYPNPISVIPTLILPIYFQAPTN